MIMVDGKDIVVVAISILLVFESIGLQNLWIAFAQGAHLKWIPIHDIASTITSLKTSEIFFHTFCGLLYHICIPSIGE